MIKQTLGQIGLGTIGRLYADHLLVAAGALWVYDTNSDRVREFEGRGARPAASCRDVGAACDTVIVALPSPEAVRSALLGPNGLLDGLAPGSLVLDMSTVDPDTSRRMYEAAREGEVNYLDAPVSGGASLGAGTEGARQASLSFLVGGDEEAFERAKPVMSILGKRFYYLGPAGRGTTVKLISNLVSGLHNLVAAEAFVLAAAAGISAETLLDVFDGTDAKSYWLTDYFAPRIRAGDFEPGFSVDLQYKDHRLASQLGDQLKVPLLFNDLAVGVYQMLRCEGLGDRDVVEAVRFLGGLARADIYAPRSREDALSEKLNGG